jgi:hypothetical protein
MAADFKIKGGRTIVYTIVAVHGETHALNNIPTYTTIQQSSPKKTVFWADTMRYVGQALKSPKDLLPPSSGQKM